MDGIIKIKLIRSPICCPEKHKRVVRGLGLTKLNQVVERHLAALETALLAEAGAGVLTLAAAGGRLAVPGSHATPHALLHVFLPGRRVQLTEVNALSLSLLKRSFVPSPTSRTVR